MPATQPTFRKGDTIVATLNGHVVRETVTSVCTIRSPKRGTVGDVMVGTTFYPWAVPQARLVAGGWTVEA